MSTRTSVAPGRTAVLAGMEMETKTSEKALALPANAIALERIARASATLQKHAGLPYPRRPFWLFAPKSIKSDEKLDAAGFCKMLKTTSGRRRNLLLLIFDTLQCLGSLPRAPSPPSLWQLWTCIRENVRPLVAPVSIVVPLHRGLTNSAGFINVETVSGAVFVEEAQAACVLSCPEESKCDFGKQPAREELCVFTSRW